MSSSGSPVAIAPDHRPPPDDDSRPRDVTALDLSQYEFHPSRDIGRKRRRYSRATPDFLGEHDYDFFPGYPVLDHGWVRLLRFDGEDEDVVRSARQSYGEGTKAYRNHQGLIDYLMEHRHATPFESVEATVQFMAPLFVVAQVERHRTFTFNQLSMRYSIAPSLFYVPSVEQMCLQSELNKQGRGDEFPPEQAQWYRDVLTANMRGTFELYGSLIQGGMARELARGILPQFTYTVVTMKGNLRNWQHFLDLRTHSHAQWEIRQYAEAIQALMTPRAPLTFQAWLQFVRHAAVFSSVEVERLHTLLKLLPTEDLVSNLHAAGMSKRQMVGWLAKLGFHPDGTPHTHPFT